MEGKRRSGSSAAQPALNAGEGLPNFRPSSKLPIQTHRHLQLARRVEDIIVGGEFAESLALNGR
jgi:hypothetical protein